MKDLKFTYNISGTETQVNFLAKNTNLYHIKIDGKETVYSLVFNDKFEEPHYVLYDYQHAVETFIFEKGGLSYLPNLIEVWMKVRKDIDYTKYLEKDLEIS